MRLTPDTLAAVPAAGPAGNGREQTDILEGRTALVALTVERLHRRWSPAAKWGSC
jgi:hypothetical protein